MTAKPSYGDLDIAAEVRRSTAASGVPYYIEDPVALDGLARMFAPLLRQTTKKPAALTTGSNESKSRGLTND